MLTRDIASYIAITPLIARSECRQYVTGQTMTGAEAARLFQNAVQNMTYDPTLDIPAETDPDFRRVRLGSPFFDLGQMAVPLIVQLEQLGGVTDTTGVMTAVDQQAFILLHEYRHVATRQTHNTREYGEWLKGLYDNCFKPQ